MSDQNTLDSMGLTPEQKAEVEKLLASRNAGKRTDTVGSLHVRISPKGAISFYGFGRFPITAYAAPLLEILSNQDAIREYLVEHKDTIVWKKNSEPGENAPEDDEILGS